MLHPVPASFLTPLARPVVADGRRRVVATARIPSGATVAAFGGRCTTRDEFDLLGADQQVRSIQIDDDLYMAAPTEPEPADFVQHSCDPNCGLAGSVLLVALRDIQAGEEISFDHAMSNGSDFADHECTCGSAQCRGKVTGHDWMLPELQLRYRGHFSPYLARRIAGLVTIGAERRAFSY